MPGEVIQVQVGECGNAIGMAFWDMILREHGIERDGLGEAVDNPGKRNVFFNNLQERYIPRCVLVDMDPEAVTVNAIKNSAFEDLFRPTNMIQGVESDGSYFMMGYYGDGANKLADESLEAIRRECEKCESFQGIIFSHGTAWDGCGAAMRIESEVGDLLSSTKTSRWNYAILHSKRVENCICASYNTLMTAEKMIDFENVVLVGNEALIRICKERLKLREQTFYDLYYLIGLMMSDISAPIRFESSQSMTLSNGSFLGKNF